MNDSERKDDVTTQPEKVTISDDMLIIVPVRNLVLFPGTVVPVAINRERSLAAAQEAVRAERKVGFVLQHDADRARPPQGRHGREHRALCHRSGRHAPPRRTG